MAGISARTVEGASMTRAPRPLARRLSMQSSLGRELVAFAALLAGVAVVLLVLPALHGRTRTVTESASYAEEGEFGYSAGELGKNVYDDNQLRAPQPLFRRLGDRLQVTYRYDVQSTAPDLALEAGHGWYSLRTELRQSNGWVRTFPVAEHQEFTGGGFTAASTLDLSTYADLIRRLEQETGFKSPTFRVRVVVESQFDGLFAGQPVSRPHEQVLDFSLNEVDLRLDREASTLSHHGSGDVTFPVLQPRMLTVPVLGAQVTYARLPRLAAVLLGLAGLGLVVSAAATWLASRGDRGAILPLKYESLVVDVDSIEEPRPARTVRLLNVDALFDIAQQYRLPVLRQRGRGGESYWVMADVGYVFVVGSVAHLEAHEAPEAHASHAAAAATHASSFAPTSDLAPGDREVASAELAEHLAEQPASVRSRVYWGAVLREDDEVTGDEQAAA